MVWRLPLLTAHLATVLGPGCAGPAPHKTVECDAVVVVHELWPGLPIGQEDVALRAFDPSQIDTEHTFALLEDVVGRVPREHMLRNELVREERLSAPDARAGLSAIVKPGSKALTARLSGAGLVQPGDYLDLLVMGPKNCPFVGRTLEAVHVLAVDGNLNGVRARKPDGSAGPAGSDNARWVTFEVTPYESTVLAAGFAYGSVVVRVRSDIDILVSDYPTGDAPPCFPIPPVP